MRDAMLAAVAQQFGTGQVALSIEWLTDNGSAYVDHRTRSFARELTPGVIDNAGTFSAEQWHGRIVREDHEATITSPVWTSLTRQRRSRVWLLHLNTTMSAIRTKPWNTARRVSSGVLPRFHRSNGVRVS
ncbi:transposase InsO family protein [Paraburkholderia sp. MM5482-R2]